MSADSGDDPVRLLAGELEDDERALLSSLRAMRPTPSAAEANWHAIARSLATGSRGTESGLTARAAAAGAFVQGSGALAAAAQGGGALAAAAQGGEAVGWAGLMSKAVALKLVLGVSVGAAAIGGGSYYWYAHGSTPSRPVATAPAVAPRAAERAHPPSENVAPATEPVASAPAQSANKQPAPRGVNSPRDTLAAESGKLSLARNQLRRGDPAAANATLDRLDARFRTGELGQEREVLRIEVLRALGKTEEAQRRARAFVERYPDSPHRAKLRHVLERP